MYYKTVEQKNSENGGTGMRKVILEEQVRLTGVKNFTGKDKLITISSSLDRTGFTHSAKSSRRIHMICASLVSA